LTDIQPNPRQPRTVFDEAGLQELAASIKTHGIKQPLRVMFSADAGGAKYTLIMGERRWRAAAIAGTTGKLEPPITAYTLVVPPAPPWWASDRPWRSATIRSCVEGVNT